MGLLFSAEKGLLPQDEELLASSYELACGELQAEHSFTRDELMLSLSSMTDGLLALYRAGQRHQDVLTPFAVYKGIHAVRQQGVTRGPSLVFVDRKLPDGKLTRVANSTDLRQNCRFEAAVRDHFRLDRRSRRAGA